MKKWMLLCCRDMPGTSDVPSVASMLPTTCAIGATAANNDASDAVRNAMDASKLETVKEEEDRDCEHGYPEGGNNTATLILKDRKNGSCVSNTVSYISFI